jgi:hypothetical protein
MSRECQEVSNNVGAAQTDLVEPSGTFHPRLVKMAPPGEKADTAAAGREPRVRSARVNRAAKGTCGGLHTGLPQKSRKI